MNLRMDSVRADARDLVGVLKGIRERALPQAAIIAGDVTTIAAPPVSPRAPAVAQHAAPAWADDHGEDHFGRYADLSVGGVTQRMRWIRPGEFLMGSPVDEPGHSAYEGPQHRVRISRGFWLADSACTQALWQAVMGSNPSHFRVTPTCPWSR